MFLIFNLYVMYNTFGKGPNNWQWLENKKNSYETWILSRIAELKEQCFSWNGNKAKKEHFFHQQLRDLFQEELEKFRTTDEITRNNIRNLAAFIGKELGQEDFWNKVVEEVQNIKEKIEWVAKGVKNEVNDILA